MAHFKRSRSKRSVRCTMCTQYRWLGNRPDRHPFRDRCLALREQDARHLYLNEEQVEAELAEAMQEAEAQYPW